MYFLRSFAAALLLPLLLLGHAAAEAEEAADWAEIRGPVKSCGVKHYPGLADFVKHSAKAYSASQLHVIQRVCDPFVQFYRWRDAEVLAKQFGFTDPAAAPDGLRRELLSETHIDPNASEEDIVVILQEHGISMPTAGVQEVQAQ